MNEDRTFLTDLPPFFNAKTEMANSHFSLYWYGDAALAQEIYSTARSASNSMWIRTSFPTTKPPPSIGWLKVIP